jgi:hypothetical protein
VVAAALAAAAAGAIEMSRKGKLRRRRALGAAACALLGPAAPAAAAEAQDSAAWQVDTATMIYSEFDRVSLVEPVIALRRSWGERSFGARLTVDTLTGPSPNGATPASTPQTFTGASGKGDIFTAAPGETPLDDAFRDTRVALALDYGAPLFGPWSATYGLNASTEYDYLSVGGSLRVQRDFNQHNTTLAVGIALAQDTLEPVGGVPAPLTVFQRRSESDPDDGEDRSLRTAEDSKTVADLLVGLTQVIDRASLFRVNLVLSQSSGYLTDPYKVLSVVDRNGEPLRYLREYRPDSRTKIGLYGEYLRAFGADTLRTSYRFQTDDWGIDSHTLEGAYRLRLGEHQYVEPQLRLYVQSAADFYRVALFDGEEQSVQHASADYRLGGMTAWTAGVQYGRTLRSGSELSLRLGYYLQTPDEQGLPPQAAAGLLKFEELVPDTGAVMVTFGYRFDW